MPDLPDYYAVLQVSPIAEPEVIEAAYRRLARKYHPDVDPSPDATRRMAELNEAYEVLADVGRRGHYDATRTKGARHSGPPGDASANGPRASAPPHQRSRPHKPPPFEPPHNVPVQNAEPIAKIRPRRGLTTSVVFGLAIIAVLAILVIAWSSRSGGTSSSIMSSAPSPTVFVNSAPAAAQATANQQSGATTPLPAATAVLARQIVADPFEFCAKAGTVAQPSDSEDANIQYTGPRDPFPNGIWRCEAGRVVGCWSANDLGSDCMQVNVNQAPGAGPVAYCRDHPNERNVPASIQGYVGRVGPPGYRWACRQGLPVIAMGDGSLLEVDAQGYARGAWEDVPDFRTRATSQSWIVIVNSLAIAEGKTRGDAEREAGDVGLYEGHVLLSDDYQSLRPGYWVVYSGQFRSQAEAQWHADHLRKQGWPTAYPRILQR